MPKLYQVLKNAVCKACLPTRVGYVAALLLAFGFDAVPASAQEQSATAVTITVEFTNTTIANALKTIDSKGSFTFFYGEQAMLLANKRVTAKFNRTPLDQVLCEIFRDSGLGYTINRNTITVFVKDKEMLREELSRHTLSGVVTDKEQRMPLVGATVVLKGTSLGKTTSSDGSYTLSVPAGGGTLIFSYVGKITREIEFTDRQNRIDVSLVDAVSEVENVVVTGYQKLDKRLSASSTTTVAMDDIKIPNVTNLSNMLQGNIPGVMVQTTSGSPNAVPRIRMRGSSTIFGNASPVWVVDGIIREDPVLISNDELNNVLYGGDAVLRDQMNQNASLSLLGNAISGVNPNDIESITFLKDASATAIYGTRAANGVIVVTTKQGKRGAPSVNFSMSLGVSAAPSYDKYNLMNSKERIGVSREVADRGYLYASVPYSTAYEGALFDYYDNKINKSQFDSRVASLETMNTDWFGLLFQNSFSQDYSASISGGTDHSSYYVSLGYNNSQGSSKGDESRQYTITSNVQTRLVRWLDVDTKLSFADRKSEGFFGVNPFDYATSTSRAIGTDEYYTTKTSTFANVLDSNYPLKYNVLNELANTGNEAHVRTVNASVGLNADLVKGLKAAALFGIGYSNSLSETWAGERSYYIAQIRGYDYGAVKAGSDAEKASRLPQGGILNYDNVNNFSYTARLQLQYNKIFGQDHAINAMAGYEVRSNQYAGFKDVEWGYFPDRGKSVSYEYDTGTSGSTSAEGTNSSLEKHTVKITDTKSNTLSAFATLVYAYKNRYVINANVRADASNRFGQYTNNKFLPVWSVAARWSITEEAWMKSQHVLDDLSLRASYGRQGNIPTSVGPNLVVKYPATVINRWSGDYQLSISRLPYPNLRWEKTNTVNLGLDFSLLDGRIAGTFDYYLKKGTDIIFNLPVAAEFGTENTYRNGAHLRNTGFELAVTFVPVRTKDFMWSITPNWSKNTNNITKTTEQKYTYQDYLVGNAYENGRPVNAIYSWKFTGLDPEKGYAQFANTSKVQSEVAAMSTDPKDYLVYSGQKDPKISGGVTTNLRYKNFAFSANFAYAFGNVRRLNFLFSGSLRMPSPQDNLSREFLNRWKDPGDDATTTIPGFVFDDKTDYLVYAPTQAGGIAMLDTYDMYNYSTARIVKGDFFRCRYMTFTWFAPKKLTGSLGVANLSCSFNVTNPFTICDKRFNGQDPEVENTGSVALPITQTYSLSVNIGF